MRSYLGMFQNVAAAMAAMLFLMTSGCGFGAEFGDGSGNRNGDETVHNEDEYEQTMYDTIVEVPYDLQDFYRCEVDSDCIAVQTGCFECDLIMVTASQADRVRADIQAGDCGPVEACDPIDNGGCQPTSCPCHAPAVCTLAGFCKSTHEACNIKTEEVLRGIFLND